MVKKVHRTKNYCRYRKIDPKKCDKRSFRTKTMSKKTKIVLCCPKGKMGKKRCKTSMRLQSVLKKHHGESCPIKLNGHKKI